MKKNAIALRRYSTGDAEIAEGAVVIGMAPSQFESFVLAGLVREATEQEVAAARAEEAPPPPARKPAKQ